VQSRKYQLPETGIIKAVAPYVPPQGYAGEVVKQFKNKDAQPHHLGTDDVYSVRETAEDHVEELLHHQVGAEVPLSCLRGYVYFGNLVRDGKKLIVDPDGIERTWVCQPNDASSKIEWVEVPRTLPALVGATQDDEARRHRPS
jgi:hypothetical protein